MFRTVLTTGHLRSSTPLLRTAYWLITPRYAILPCCVLIRAHNQFQFPSHSMCRNDIGSSPVLILYITSCDYPAFPWSVLFTTYYSYPVLACCELELAHDLLLRLSIISMCRTVLAHDILLLSSSSMFRNDVGS